MAINRKPKYAVIDEYSIGFNNFKGWRAYYKAEPNEPFKRIILLQKGYPKKGNLSDEQVKEIVDVYNAVISYNNYVKIQLKPPKYIPKVISRATMHRKIFSCYHFIANYLTEEKFNKIFEKLMIHLI